MTQAIELFRELGDKPGEAYALNHLGLVYGYTADFRATIDCHQQALELALAAGDKLAEAVSLTDLGMGLLLTGAYLGFYRELPAGAVAVPRSWVNVRRGRRAD